MRGFERRFEVFEATDLARRQTFSRCLPFGTAPTTVGSLSANHGRISSSLTDRHCVYVDYAPQAPLPKWWGQAGRTPEQRHLTGVASICRRTSAAISAGWLLGRK
jgi:hypothetical protein